jgi:hypothetical protein
VAVPEDPVAPEGGFEPEGEVVLLGGLDPEEVFEPEEGVDPEDVFDPEDGVDPDAPVDPEDELDPEDPADPDGDVDPDDPVAPDDEVDPEEVVDPEDGLVLVDDGGLDVAGAVDPEAGFEFAGAVLPDDGFELELAGGLLDVLPVVAPFPDPAAAPSLLLPPHPANANAHTNETAHSGRTRVRCLSIQHTPNVRVVECRSNTLCRVHTPSRQSRRESQPRQPLQVACRNRTIDRSLTAHPTS